MRPRRDFCITEAQRALDNHPDVGTVVTRMHFGQEEHCFFLQGGYGDCVWQVTTNYQCLDTYGPEQRIRLLGVVVTVWAHDQRTCVHDTAVPGDNLALLIACMYLRALQQCAHPRAKEIYATMRGDHEYECPDCGAKYHVDSSD